MTDSHDRISGPAPADATDDVDSQTFFQDEPRAGERHGDAPADAAVRSAGYTGGLAGGTGSAAGTRGVTADELSGNDDASDRDDNLAQQDQ